MPWDSADVTNATLTDSDQLCTSITTSSWNSGSISTAQSAEFEFTIGSAGYVMVTFYNSFDALIPGLGYYFQGTSTYDIERRNMTGSMDTPSTWSTSDTFKMQIDADRIKLYKNDVLIDNPTDTQTAEKITCNLGGFDGAVSSCKLIGGASGSTTLLPPPVAWI